MVCLSVAHARRRADRPHGPAARRPRDGARAHDDGRDAPAAPAAAAAWRRERALRLFVALDLPARGARGARALPRRGGRPGGLAAAAARRRSTSRSRSSGTGRRRTSSGSPRCCAGLAPRGAAALALGAGLLLPPRRARVLTVALDDRDGRAGRAAGRGRRGAGRGGRVRARGAPVPAARDGRAAARRRARAAARWSAEPEPLAFRRGRGHALPLAARARRRGLRAALRAVRLTHYSRSRMTRAAGDHDSGARRCCCARARRAGRGEAALARLSRGRGRRSARRVRVPLDRSGALAGSRRAARRARRVRAHARPVPDVPLRRPGRRGRGRDGRRAVRGAAS